MKKRILALILAVATMLTALPIEAFAYGGTGSYYGNSNPQPSTSGTTEDSGYRISVQMVTLDSVIQKYTKDSFESASASKLKEKFSKCLPCGDNKAVYFFNFKSSAHSKIYTYLGTSFDKEYNVKTEEKAYYLDEASSTWNDTEYNKFFKETEIKHDYTQIEELATSFVSKGANVKSYLKHIEHLCISGVSNSIDSTEVQNFFYPKDDANANEKTLFHMLVLSKILGLNTDGIQNYVDAVNAKKKITEVPIILIESLASFLEADGTFHTWTLAQWIAKVKGWGDTDAYKRLYTTKVAMGSTKGLSGEYDENFRYLTNFLNPLTTKAAATYSFDSSVPGTLAWASYGLIINKSENGKTYGLCSRGNGAWRRSTLGLAQNCMSSNSDYTMSEKFDVYPGYSFYWMNNPCSSPEPATYNVKLKAVWWNIDDSSDDSNGLTKVTRQSPDTQVATYAHYAVYGSDVESDSEIVKWLESKEGKERDYTLEISIYNQKLSSTQSTKVSEDNNTFYSANTLYPNFKNTFSKSISGNELATYGYKCESLSYSEIINFLKGNACVYFYSDRYYNTNKKEAETYYANAEARVSIYPTGMKDEEDVYPWSSATVKSDQCALRYVSEGHGDGQYIVQADEEFSNKEIGNSGYYYYNANADNWQTTMNIVELGDFVSNTDGLDVSKAGTVAITLSAQAAHPLFYNAKLNNGLACTTPNNGLSLAKPMHSITSSSSAEEKLIYKLETEMARIYNESVQHGGAKQTSTNSKIVYITGNDVAILRQMIIDKTKWGITGYVNKGTWQNIEATLDMTFGIDITWKHDSTTVHYTLSTENDTVTKIYPCHESKIILFAQNSYHVDATPDAKVIQLDDTNSYDLGAKGEKGEVSTTFTIGSDSRYNSIIESCKSINKGDIQVTITRADDDGSSGVFVSRGDKLNLGNATSFGLKRKEVDGNVWIWDGATPIYKVLKSFAEDDAEFVIQDTLESGKYVLTTANPIIMLCYKIEITMNVYVSEHEQVNITWTPDPGQDTVSWLANVDLYFNSAVDANFAEIKEGSPTKETYEAMSGVPVTANLYYATGGHEFVVNTSYQIQQFSPSREYYYCAHTSACDESWIQTKDSSLKCIDVTECENHKLVETYTAGADGTCTLTCDKTTDTITCKDAGCTVEGCTTTHTKPHEHTKECYTHSGGSSDTLGSEVTEYCSAGPWKKTYYALDGDSYVCETCGAEYKRAKAHEESCVGQKTDTYSVYINVAEDLKIGDPATHTWKHCGCHCPASTHWECNPDVKTYSESWYTTMSDVYYTVITQCYVWRLAANYLTTNQDLIETDDVIYSGWLPTEDDVSAPGYVYFWSCDKANLANNIGNILGRIHYYWHDGEYHFLYDLKGNVVGVEDYISLNATMAGSGFAGDIGKTHDKTLYTCDDCDCSKVGGRTGHTYDKLYEYYLKHIKDDGGIGQRFGMSVVSDFLFYSANSDDVQAIYYNEYNLYAGTVKNTNNEDGTPLHDVAKFNCSYTKNQTHTVSECTVSANTGCYKTTIDYTGTEVAINDTDYTTDSKGFLWEKNTTCVGHKEDDGSLTIDVDDLARAGYNGLEDTNNIEEKYTPRNICNFTYSTNRAIMKYWDTFYAEGYLYHRHKNGTSKEDIFAKSYDKGKYIYYCPVDLSTLLPKPPEKQPLPFYLGMQDLDISDIAENGLYELGKVENFYECLIKYDPNNKGHIYDIKEVSWAGNASSPIETKGFTVPTTYYYGDSSADNRYINEVVVYVPSAADIGIGISEGTTKFIDDRANRPSTGITAINLEADGIINFPLVSVIQEIPDNTGSFATCVSQIGKGYGGYGNALDVIRDPHNGLQWVKRKWITVSNYVIVDTDGDGSFADEHVYAPYEEINLSIFDANGNYIEDYPFYLPEMAYEDASTTVVYYTSSINNTVNEDTMKWEPNNVYETYSMSRDLYRYHGATNSRIFQAVGRIGNLTMVDTGDFRYSNFFKASTGEWLVPNVVYKVDQGEQVRVVIDEYDIFDRKGGGKFAWNTYGSQDHKESLVNSEPSSSYDIISGTGTRRTHYYALPLLPRYNNIDAFKDTPMRVGYTAYLDVETIGNYYNGTDYVTVEYSYYGMDKNNNLHPLDVYMLKDGEYVLINDFYNDYDKITSYPVYMNWEDENERRKFTEKEKERTEKVNEFMQGTNAYDMFTGEIDKVYPYYPSGNTIYQGDYNSAILGFDSRTFIGDYYYGDVMPGFPDNDNTNVGGYIPAWKYYRNSQKWYFSNELPSSAVFVEAGQKCTKENIDATTVKYDKAVVTAIITAHGTVWDLRHDGSNSWTKLKEAYPPSDPTPPNYPPSNPPTPTPPSDDPELPPDTPEPPTVITIIPIPETSRDDVTTIGTH